MSGSGANGGSNPHPSASSGSNPSATFPPSLDQHSFQYLRPRDPSAAQPVFTQNISASGIDSPRGDIFDEIDDDDEQLNPMSGVAAGDDFDSPGVHDTALELPSFHQAIDRVADEDDDDEGGSGDSDGNWSDSASESEDSASASDLGWYGHGRMPPSHNSSVASRLVNLDEEISAHEQNGENARHAAKMEASRRKRAEEQNARLPCPPMCGVSWGINGQLIYFSNLPLLTHYLVTNQRRRQNPNTSIELTNSSLETTSTSDAHRLQSVPSDPTPHIDHEEEENSAWAGASASTHAMNTASNSTPSASLTLPNTTSSFSSMLDVDEVLPRTYQDLLQLPFVAAHLGYVVGEDLEEKQEEVEQEINTPPEPSPLPSETTNQWPTNSAAVISTGSMKELNNAQTNAPLPVPLPSPSIAPSTEAVLDLGSVSLDSMNVASSNSAGGSGARTLKVSLSSASLPRLDSSSQLDQLSDTYDVLEYGDAFDGSSQINGLNEGSEDFFSSFYNSTLQLGVASAVKQSNTFKKPDGTRSTVPPLPSMESKKESNIAAEAAALIAPANPSAIEASTTEIALAAAEPSAHSWTALSSRTALPTSSPVKRRIRINTSVLIMDCQDIMPCNKRLAKEYTLSGADCVAVCRYNQTVCQRLGRFDLANTWQLAGNICQPFLLPQLPSLQPWREHPMGGKLAEQLIQQYLRVGDIQTVAMLTSVFSFRADASNTSSLLPSRPPPTLVDIQGMEGMLVPSIPSPSPITVTSPAPAASTNTQTGHESPVMVAVHPMALLPSTVEGSNRTWAPGSKITQSTTRNLSHKSSGTASPGDTIYNLNANQRSKWRTEDSANSSASRLRSGSLTSRADTIPRIEEMHETQPSNDVAPTLVTSSELVLAPSPVLQLRVDVFDLYLYLYAEYLYRIGEFSVRAKLLKFVADSQPDTQHCITGFAVNEQICGVAAVCQFCHREQPLNRTRPYEAEHNSPEKEQSGLAMSPRALSPANGLLSPPSPAPTALGNSPLSPRCAHCYHFPLSCSICQLSVKGLTLLCALCGHGGHPACLASWFRSGQSQCPSACGCQCENGGGLQIQVESSSSHRAKQSKRARKKESELRALEVERQQAAAVEAQLVDQLEAQAAAADEAEHSEQLHFYNPAR